jgi:hypothetical protein
MEVLKIKVGSTYNYTARAHSGRAKVVGIRHGASGVFVLMLDKARKLRSKTYCGEVYNVAVRPSQVSR